MLSFPFLGCRDPTTSVVRWPDKGKTDARGRNRSFGSGLFRDRIERKHLRRPLLTAGLTKQSGSRRQSSRILTRLLTLWDSTPRVEERTTPQSLASVNSTCFGGWQDRRSKAKTIFGRRSSSVVSAQNSQIIEWSSIEGLSPFLPR